MNKLILVDKNNRKIGVEEKIKTHKKGLLHRAFSIFVFNSNGELLLQKRAKSKYHSGGLWSNTVCSHPRNGENYQQAIHRRLKEEMGFDCNLEKITDIIYKSKLKNGLIENEYDRILRGEYNGDIEPNPEEVMDYKWISLEELKKDINNNPDKYTSWFKIILNKLNYFQ